MNLKKYKELIESYKLPKRVENLVLSKIKNIENYKYNEIKIVLNEDVKGQGRPRVGFFKNIYDPDGKYKKILSNKIVEMISNKYGFKISKNTIKGKKRLKKRISKDISVEIKHYKEIVKSFSQTKKILCELNLIKVATTPDIDNIEKLILDTLNQSIIKDDRFLWKIKTIKKWAKESKCIIKIRYRE